MLTQTSARLLVAVHHWTLKLHDPPRHFLDMPGRANFQDQSGVVQLLNSVENL